MIACDQCDGGSWGLRCGEPAWAGGGRLLGEYDLLVYERVDLLAKEGLHARLGKVRRRAADAKLEPLDRIAHRHRLEMGGGSVERVAAAASA